MREWLCRGGIGAVALAAALPVLGGSVDCGIPHPLPPHPGNIFLAGEPVTVAEPPGQSDAWRAVDYDGRTVARGNFQDGLAKLGPLPVGWYKVIRGERGHWTNRVTLGVLEALRARTPATSPIGIDVALAWCCPREHWADMISLCQLAGISRVRDRSSWPEIEPRRGTFASQTRYDDSIREQTAAGLRVLQVNHIAPSWANTNATRFPTDLRDAYDFFRAMASRWHGQIEAFEPWNEADLKDFGGHTGSEMATFQKAAWLGLKAGDPELTVCENVFGIHQSSTLRDFQENQAWPYFETFNLHHYDPFEKYPWLFSQMRSVSAGKPMWVTECNVIVQWQDETTHEPSEADLRIQSERVPMIYSMDLYQGAKAVFYFMLPNYVEYRRQYGVLHADLSPRPAYLAVAAAGRLLADAKPLGRVRSPRPDIQGYLFKAKPDGRTANVLVIWSDTNATFTLTKAPAACFDHLGRARTVSGNVLNLNRTPQYVELAKGTRLALIPPPKPAELLTGRPGPVVLQALLPASDIVLDQSAWRLPEGRSMVVPIVVYNFSRKTLRGRLQAVVPSDWAVELADKVEMGPGERKPVNLLLTHPLEAAVTNAAVRVIGRFDGGNSAVVSFHLVSPEKKTD